MLRTMILQDKRLEKARDESWRVDQKLYARCQELFVEVDKECRELDRRHAKVLDAEEKMGGNPKCGNADEECASCVRLKEREAGTKAAEEMMVKEKKEGE